MGVGDSSDRGMIVSFIFIGVFVVKEVLSEEEGGEVVFGRVGWD